LFAKSGHLSYVRPAKDLISGVLDLFGSVPIFHREDARGGKG